MMRRSRLWIGLTILIVILFNYVMIGVPLWSKGRSIEQKSRVILLKQAKSPNSIFKSSEDDYLLEIFRREKAGIDRKLMILNLVAVSLGIIAASWTVFGAILGKDK